MKLCFELKNINFELEIKLNEGKMPGIYDHSFNQYIPVMYNSSSAIVHFVPLNFCSFLEK